MDRTRFEERVKQIVEDMNALNEMSEGGIAEAILALTGGNQDVLFDNLPQIVTDLGAQFQIAVAAQRFSVNGIIGQISAGNQFVSKADNYHKIYFVLSRNSINALRDRLIITGSSLSVAQQSVTVKDETFATVVLRSSGSSATPPTPPPLGPNDIGYIEYCEVIWDTATLTDNHNIAALYMFPGGGIALLPHGVTHLTSDPVPDAALGGTGSTKGLMPIDSYLKVVQSLQSLTVDGASPYLTRSISADRIVTLLMRITNALKIVDDGGTMRLGLNFASGPFSGNSGLPAQTNHTHSQEDYPIRVLNYHVTQATLDSGDLNSIIDVAEFTSIAQIYKTQVFWLPPGQAADAVPAVDCGWMMTDNGIAGARGNIFGPKEVKVETGDLAFCKMNDATRIAVAAAIGGINWTYSNTPNEPTSGELLLRIVALR